MNAETIKNVFLPLHPLFFRIAYRFLGDKDDAKDAVQDLYLKICTRCHDIETIQNPQGYGVKILKNICLDKIKSKHNERISPKESNIKGSNNTDNLVNNKDIKKSILISIQSLPPNQKEIIILRDIEDMDLQEIAKITGLNQGNIRVLLSRARKTIREKLNTINNEYKS